jgi:hypothetical protein
MSNRAFGAVLGLMVYFITWQFFPLTNLVPQKYLISLGGAFLFIKIFKDDYDFSDYTPFYWAISSTAIFLMAKFPGWPPIGRFICIAIIFLLSIIVLPKLLTDIIGTNRKSINFYYLYLALFLLFSFINWKQALIGTGAILCGVASLYAFAIIITVGFTIIYISLLLATKKAFDPDLEYFASDMMELQWSKHNIMRNIFP